jgi:hypothetical protein
MKANGRGTILIYAVLTLTGAAASFAADSPPVLVDAAYRSKHWMTVYTNAVPLTWVWNMNATSATLAISGMNSAFATNFVTSASNYLWQVSGASVPAAEDVYILTLTFSNNTSVVGALTSRLAVVAGALGQTPVNPVAGSRAWSLIKKNAVIPYDASWTEAATNAASARLVVAKEGGATETNAFPDVAGYTNWKLVHGAWGYGTFDLTLSFLGATNTWAAVLMRPLDGTMIGMQ